MIFKIKWWYYGFMFDLNHMDAEMYNKKMGKRIDKMKYYNKKKEELLLSIKGDK